ncbi:MAG: hypothetical protein PHH30_11420 [Bacteroidales bacterium]|nr:hypothetical protein [Bacteroidales bacterium]MDD3859526.1 hypothetical protein [Bacteroidales bacterium]
MKKQKNQKMPKFSDNLFWDIDIQSLDYKEHSSFIIARVLDYGTWQDWKELCNCYSKEQIKEASLQIRSLFPKSLNFVAFYTDTPISEFRCYKLRQSTPTLWNS